MGLVLLGWIKNLVVMKADNKGKQLIVSLLIRVKNSIFHVQSYTSIGSSKLGSWPAAARRRCACSRSSPHHPCHGPLFLLPCLPACFQPWCADASAPAPMTCLQCCLVELVHASRPKVYPTPPTSPPCCFSSRDPAVLLAARLPTVLGAVEPNARRRAPSPPTNPAVLKHRQTNVLRSQYLEKVA